LLIIPLDKKISKPIYRQIVDKIAKLIESDTLKEDDTLPSTRRLSEQLGISRQTVVQAYEELWSLGYLRSSQGAYTKIRKRPSIVKKHNRGKMTMDYEKEIIGKQKAGFINALIKTKNATTEQTKIIDMSAMDLDSSIFPVDTFRKTMNNVLKQYPPSLLNYGDPQGYRPLIEWISQRMLTHSIDVFPDEILLTDGISQAFELLVKLFTERGDTVFVESPGYRQALSLLAAHGVNVIGVPMKVNGMDLKVLKKKLEASVKMNKRPKFIYTVPTFHNPTGITITQQHRERLISLCLDYSVPLIEDSFEEEIRYYNRVVLPIKSMDHHQIVFYLGTFSKVLFPGLRIGWLAGEKGIIKKLTALKKLTHLSSNTLTQAALYEFCKAGHYERFIKKVNDHYASKMSTAIKLMKECLSFDQVSWHNPSGGYLFWLKVDVSSENESDLLKLCEKNGVKVLGGSKFFIEAPESVYLRVCVSSTNIDEIKKGIRILSISIRDFLTNRA